MTGKERVLAAIDRHSVDRIPTTFEAEKEVYERLHTDLGTGNKVELFDRLGVDTWLVGPTSQTPPPEVAGLECPDGQSSGSIWGFRTRRVDYQGGSYGELAWSPLAGKDSLSDIRNHPWPGPDALDFAGTAAECDAHADRALYGAFGWGPFFRATWVRGMEGLLLDLALRRDYAEALIRTISEITLAHLDRLLDAAGDRLDIVYMADDYCSHQAPLFSPTVFEDLVLPYLREHVDRAHAAGCRFLLHCCGAVRPLLPMILDAGVDLLEPIQVRAAGMAPEGLAQDFGERLGFWGGVDLQHVLCRESPDGVRREVRRLIDTLGAGGGGYVLGPGHTFIQVDAPTENILAMYDEARQYGRGD